jgi:hypothetical protein
MVSVTSQWAQLWPTRMNTYYAFGGACYIIIQQIIKNYSPINSNIRESDVPQSGQMFGWRIILLDII